MQRPPLVRVAWVGVVAGLVAGCSRPPPPRTPGDAVCEAAQELEAARAELRQATAELREAREALQPLVELAETTREKRPQRRPVRRPVDAGAQRELRELLDRGIERVGENRYEVTREVVHAVLENPASVARGARIVPSIRDGRANGFKLYAIRPNSVFGRLGLKNGDTLHAVNGHQLTTPDKALEVYSRIRGADRLTVAITRRGSPIEFTYVIGDDANE